MQHFGEKTTLLYRRDGFDDEGNTRVNVDCGTGGL